MKGYAFWIRNIDAGIALMQSKTDQQVDLGDWEDGCGTVACFGGWLPHSPHFKALGVEAGQRGAPYIGAVSSRSVEVADYLFGDLDLFRARRHSAEPNGTDREVVIARLQRLRAVYVEASQ